MQEGGLDPVGGTPQALGAFTVSAQAKCGAVVHDVGAKATHGGLMPPRAGANFSR
jgi:hypothetical protein